MPYQAERDATIAKVIAEHKGPDGQTIAAYESVNYARGHVIFETDIAPHVLRRLEEGDDHLSSLLRYIDEAEARQILAQQQEQFAPQSRGDAEITHLDNPESSGPTAGPQFEETAADSPADPEPPTVETTEETQGSTEEVVQEAGTTSKVVLDEGAESSTAVDPDAGQTTETTETDPGEQSTGETTEGDGEGAEESVSTEETVAEDSGEQTEGQTTESSEQTESSEDEASTTEAQEGTTETTEESAEATPTDPLAGLSKTQLKDKAKELKISGRSTMSEDELRAAITKAEEK